MRLIPDKSFWDRKPEDFGILMAVLTEISVILHTAYNVKKKPPLQTHTHEISITPSKEGVLNGKVEVKTTIPPFSTPIREGVVYNFDQKDRSVQFRVGGKRAGTVKIFEHLFKHALQPKAEGTPRDTEVDEAIRRYF